MSAEQDFQEPTITPEEWEEILAEARKTSRSEGEAEDVAWCHASAICTARWLDLEEARYEREKQALKDQAAPGAAPLPN